MENTQKKTTENVQYEVFTSFITPKKHQEILERMTVLFEASGMTAAQLSKMTSVSESTITRYFAGTTKNPHLYAMATMIIALGGDINEVLGISSPKESTDGVQENPYGELLDSYREETKTLRNSIEKLTSDFDALTKKIAASNKALVARTIALIVIIGIFCTLEIIDICNPDWGRYQWAVEAIHNLLYNNV